MKRAAGRGRSGASDTAPLQSILFDQGFGSRRECIGLVLAGRVRHAGVVLEDPDLELPPNDLVLEVDGRTWPVREFALILLHKPAGYECSLKPRHHPGVLSLLPPPLRVRGVQPVGRLDEDTTGLLLLTDDGTLNHRLTSPKWHVPKTYVATCRHPVDDAALAQLLAGVVLNDDPEPVAALQATRGEPRQDEGHALILQLEQGKYHQVKRMVAAVGNRVDALHRFAMGPLVLEPELRPGDWRWLTVEEETALRGLQATRQR